MANTPEAKKQEVQKVEPRSKETQPLPLAEQEEILTVKDKAKDGLDSCAKKERAELLTQKDTEQDRENIKNYINTYATGVEGIEHVEDLRTLSLTQLFKLEEKYEGILFYAFTDFMDGCAKLDFARWQNAYKEPHEGDKFKINFLGNQEAYDKLGAGDILPPAIRRITVLENGDESRKRVSEKRIGLKGTSDSKDSGFFDKQGYIPVFTGDVIVIGAPNKEFDKYRTSDGKLDYKAYAESEFGKKESAECEKFIKDNPPKQKQKQPTPEEIDALMRGIDAEGKGQKVVDAVNKALKEGMRGDHCWDWVDKVYKKAGTKYQRIYQDLNYSGKDCGSHHASEALMSKLRPGDWLYINNKNKSDENGCHSAIFLEWINEEKQIARLASCPGAGKKGHIARENLNKKPVTYIAKPV